MYRQLLLTVIDIYGTKRTPGQQAPDPIFIIPKSEKVINYIAYIKQNRHQVIMMSVFGYELLDKVTGNFDRQTLRELS